MFVALSQVAPVRNRNPRKTRLTRFDTSTLRLQIGMPMAASPPSPYAQNMTGLSGVPEEGGLSRSSHVSPRLNPTTSPGNKVALFTLSTVFQGCSSELPSAASSPRLDDTKYRGGAALVQAAQNAKQSRTRTVILLYKDERLCNDLIRPLPVAPR
jgi:hypothetical protein